MRLEYEEAESINRSLRNEGTGKVLVFLRHTYYLKVAFLYADPSASSEIHPSQYLKGEWLEMFHQQGVRWVVRSPEYPPAIGQPLYALEAQGKRPGGAR